MREARSARPPVGNDVVDRSHPRCRDKVRDARFLERVFDVRERERILAASDVDRALWRAWGAKEAAFKVISKVRGSPPPFSHIRLRVTDDGPAGGVVAYGDVEITFREELHGSNESVHVLAWLPGSRPRIETRVEVLPDGPPPVERLTDRERRAVYSAASGWIRVLAKADLAEVLGLPPAAVEIACSPGPPGRGIPHVLVHGRADEWDISLSHHGRFLAWALAGPAARPGRAQEGR